MEPWNQELRVATLRKCTHACTDACIVARVIIDQPHRLIAVLYVLDTDVVIFMLRGLKARAGQRTRRDKALALVGRSREAQAKGDVVGLSAVTVSELESGA